MSANPPAPDPERFRFYITEIGFQPPITDPNCKISAKLFVDDELAHSFPWLDHTQPPQWSRLLACDVAPFSRIVLKLYKTVNDRQRSFIFPPYQMSGVNENGETSLEHPKILWNITIKSLTPTAAVGLFPGELDRLSRIQGAYDSLSPDETVKFLFKAALQFASIVAAALPESTSKLSFLILMKTWEQLEQINHVSELDETIQEIIRGLIRIQDVVEVLRQASNSVLASAINRSKEPINNILKLLDDMSVYVFNRLVTDCPVSRDEVHSNETFNIQEYLARLENLQSVFYASWSTLPTPRMDSTNVVDDEPPTWQGVLASANNPAVRVEDPYEMLNLLGPMNPSGYEPDQACMDGTRQAVLNKIITWTQNHDNPESFLWISGQAGMGKTSIATSLCQRLDSMQALAGSFFCQHDDPDRNHPHTLIDNIVHDIAMQCPAYAYEVANAIRANRKLCKAHLGLRYEGLVQKPLERLRSLSMPITLVLVIDGLDECGDRDSRGRILHKIYDMSKLVPWLKIVITARPVGDIQVMGKTSIATTLCQRLDSMQALAGSFFCQHDDPHRNHPDTLINNTVHDIAMQCPAYAYEVANAIRANRKLCKAHLGLRYEGLVQKPLERLRSLSMPITLVLVIDGLDECGDRDSRGRILHKIYNMTMLVPWLKIVITARPVGDIQECFRHDFPREPIMHLHDFHACDDIRAYIEDQLGEFAQTEVWPHDNINRLCNMAQGVFLWAAVATKYIKHSTTPALSRLERILDNRKSPVTDWFDALYTRALDTAIDDKDDETKDAYLRCIGAIIATSEREPLAVPELQYLLLVAGRVDQLTIERVIKSLGPLLLRLDGRCAKFYHSSFKDYITNSSRSGDFLIQLDQYEAEPAACCLKLMERDLRFNICELDTSHILNSEVPDLKLRIDSHIGPALKYACLHWIDHFIASPNQALVAEIRKLFEGPQLMYWIEVLSLLGCLDLAVTGLSALASATLPQIDDWSLMVFWVKDIRRFLLSFYNAIAASTPHLYVSALAFAPTTSPITQRMRAYFPNTIKVAKGGNLTWHPCVTSILHPHAIPALSVCLNGRRVATGYPDGSLCVWDTQTGARVCKPLVGHSTSVTCVAFSPDGNFVASSSYDASVRVWDLSSSIPASHALTGHSGCVHAVSFSPSATLMASMRVWDLSENIPTSHILTGHSGSVHAISFSPSAALMASSSSDQTIRLWDTKAMKSVGHPYAGHSSRISCLAFSPDGTKLASGSWDKTIRVWSVDLGGFQLAMSPLLITGCSDPITCVAFSPDGSKVASGSVGRTIRTWDVQTGSEIEPYTSQPKQSNSITSIAFSLNGKLIASSSLDGVIQLWDATTLAAFSQPFGHSSCVNGIAFSPDGAYVISVSADMTVRIWDINACPKSMAVAPLVGHSDSIYCIACSSDGTRIISGSNDRTVRLWDAQNCTPIGDPFVGHTEALECVAFSPDGTQIASGSCDNTLKLWDTTTHALIHSYQHSSIIRCIRFSADGALIVFGAADSIYLWDSPKWRMIGNPLQGHSKLVLSVAFSPDGTRLASSSGDHTVILWDLTTHSPLGGPLLGHTDWVRSIAFSPCGTQVVSGSVDKTVRIWGVSTGNTIHTLDGHSGPVTTVAFSPDGSHIASGSYDKTVRLWNAKTGQILGDPLIGHSHRVWSLTFSPSGSHIISGSTDGTVRVCIPGTSYSATEAANDLPGTFCWPANPHELSSHPHHPGWVTHDQQSLILWLPMHYQQPAQFLRTHSWVPTPQTFLDYSNFVHGTNWTRVACDSIRHRAE
ncbi:hypothetical protein RSAG8_04121, partial [Rhizoctonia solani AG-8 WAC10335]